MNIVFLRHGKAEPPSDAQPDVTRELTSIGRKKMKQAARGLANVLFPDVNILIWTSPATRARQTAQLLKDEFGKRAVLRVVDILAVGTLVELRAELSSLPAESTLFFVGHEPMVSGWVKSLCGADIAFRPASAASITLDGDTGLLNWFMRVGIMAHLGTITMPKRRQRS